MKGFTLVEIMIVVCVMGIIIAVALPAYNNRYGKTDKQKAVLDSIRKSHAQGQPHEYCHDNHVFILWPNGQVTPKPSRLGTGVESC